MVNLEERIVARVDALAARARDVVSRPTGQYVGLKVDEGENQLRLNLQPGQPKYVGGQWLAMASWPGGNTGWNPNLEDVVSTLRTVGVGQYCVAVRAQVRRLLELGVDVSALADDETVRMVMEG